MSEPTWPVFLLDGRDLAAYEGEGALRGDVEAWMSDQPVAFLDAVGRPLRLLKRGQATLGVEVTGEAANPERLRCAVADYLAAIGETAPDEADLASFSREAAGIINRREG